jgi:ribosomal-protein-alanine N-acetyltransferase
MKDNHYHVRWLIRRDLPEVLHIDETANPDHCWTEDEFLSALRSRNCIGMVVEKGETVVGFMIYELHKSKLHVLHMCVHPEMQKNGVGTAMVNKLFEKLSSDRRTKITMLVPDSLTDMHLFLRKMGFKGKFVKTPYYDTNEDGYHFEYRLEDHPYPVTAQGVRDKSSFAE